MTAILPGVAFGQLWSILSSVEIALLVISVMVVFTAFLGMMIGFGTVYFLMIFATPLIEQATGLFIELTYPDVREFGLLLFILSGGFLAGLLPAFRAYKTSLADGLIIRT